MVCKLYLIHTGFIPDRNSLTIKKISNDKINDVYKLNEHKLSTNYSMLL